MLTPTPDLALFPSSVSQYSVALPIDDARPWRFPGIELPPRLQRAAPERQQQFLAGRACARWAIERIKPDAPTLALAQDADGCPIWPEGLVGSISHTATFATAAVALLSDARGLGVDVEPVMSREAADDVARLVAGHDETRRVAQTAQLDPLEALTLVFSAKESLFKALYPSTRRHFDYLDCEIVRVDSKARRFFITFRPPFDAVFGAGTFSGRYAFAGDVRTGALIPPI